MTALLIILTIILFAALGLGFIEAKQKGNNILDTQRRR